MSAARLVELNKGTSLQAVCDEHGFFGDIWPYESQGAHDQAREHNLAQHEAYTPTTEQVRDGYAIDPIAEYHDPITNHTLHNERAFNRWLAAHDAEVRADQQEKDAQVVGDWLTDRAGQGLELDAENMLAAIRGGAS